MLIAQARHRRRASVSSPHVSKGSASIPHFAARPIELDDIAGSRHIAELADSVFAIGRSTFGDDIRYIKHLKSRNTPLLPEEGWTPHFGGRGGGSHDASNVLTYRIERMEIGKLKKQNDSGDSQLSILTSQLPPKPFLGLTYLGDAAENDHLRDYGAPLLPEEGWTQSGRGGGRARLAQSREQNELQKLRTQTSRSALIAGLMDGSYTRYLKG